MHAATEIYFENILILYSNYIPIIPETYIFDVEGKNILLISYVNGLKYNI